MKLASYDRIAHDLAVIGRILSASRAVLKTYLKNYSTICCGIQFQNYDNFITEKTA